MLSLGLSTSTAQAARKALVIGNADYAVDGLKNPVNDARDMHKLFKSTLDFDRSTLVVNVSRRELIHAVRRFYQSLKRTDIAVVYYAGHGLQGNNGLNYMIPIDAEISSIDDIQYEGYALNAMLAKLDERKGGANIVFFDACRNNPYTKNFSTKDRAFSSVRGLSRQVVPNASGTMIAFATQPGLTAKDNCGRNGCFTEQLLKYFASSEQNFTNTMRQVKIALREKTGQIPSIEGLTDKEIYLQGESLPVNEPMTKLTINVEPEGSRIRIMNITDKYLDGMELKKGSKYRLYVTHQGYKRFDQWVELDQRDKQVIGVVLEQLEKPISPTMVKKKANDLYKQALKRQQNQNNCDEANQWNVPVSQFTFNGDGTVSDKKSGLMWKQCVEGVSGDLCDTGKAIKKNREDAKVLTSNVDQYGKFAGYKDWRLPTIDELKTIIEKKCTNPSINTGVFPKAKGLFVWSSTPSDEHYSGYAWYVNFNNGKFYGHFNRYYGYKAIRLVRNGL